MIASCLVTQARPISTCRVAFSNSAAVSGHPMLPRLHYRATVGRLHTAVGIARCGASPLVGLPLTLHILQATRDRFAPGQMPEGPQSLINQHSVSASAEQGHTDHHVHPRQRLAEQPCQPFDFAG